MAMRLACALIFAALCSVVVPVGAHACVHDMCVTGDPLDPSCGACARRVCQQDPICCSSQWDSTCVALIETACDSVRCLQGADDCASAVTIDDPARDVKLIGTLVGATPDGCASEGLSCNNADVWYSYTFPVGATRPRFTNTCGTQYSFGTDTVISLHYECPGDLASEIFSNDDWRFGPDPVACKWHKPQRWLDSSIPVPIFEPGHTYKIRVSHFDISPEGSYQIFLPEPSSGLLGGAGLATLFALSRGRQRRRRRSSRG